MRTPLAHEVIDVDLWDPATFADGPPYEAFAALRRAAPVAWHPERARRAGGTDGPGFWCVTGHAEIHEVSTDAQTFSSWLGGFTGADLSAVVLEETRLNLMGMDPPDHTHLWQAIRAPFMREGVRSLTDVVAGYAAEVVDAAAHKGETDFVADFASELPLLVLSHLMGVPPEDR